MGLFTYLKKTSLHKLVISIKGVEIVEKSNRLYLNHQLIKVTLTKVGKN